MPWAQIAGVQARRVTWVLVMRVLTLGTTMPQAQTLSVCSGRTLIPTASWVLPAPKWVLWVPSSTARPFTPHRSQLLPHARGCLRAAPAGCPGRRDAPAAGAGQDPAPWPPHPSVSLGTKVGTSQEHHPQHPCPMARRAHRQPQHSSDPSVSPPGAQGARGAALPHLPQHPGAAGRSRSRWLSPGGARQLRVRLGNPHRYGQWTFVLL